MDTLIAILLFVAVLTAIAFFKGLLNPKKAKRDSAEFYLSYYDKTPHYQFVTECQNRGVKDINNPADMKIAMNILQYDQRFANLPKTPSTVKEQFEKYRKAQEKAAAHRSALSNLDSEHDKAQRAFCGDEAFEMLCSISGENFHNWKKYRGKGIVAVLRCQNFNDYIIFKGKKGICTYYKNEVYAGVPSFQIKQLLEAQVDYVPGKATYTGATVGGITTGGWDVKQAHTELRMTHQGHYGIFLGIGSHRDNDNRLMMIWLSENMVNFAEYNSSLQCKLDKKEKTIELDKESKEFCQLIVSMLNNM